MSSFDVSLLMDRKPVFPDACVSCEKQHPGSTMDLSVLVANTTTLAEDVGDAVFDTGARNAARGNFSHRITGIPICKGCERSMKWYHRLLKFATYTIWIPALALFLLAPGPTWLKIPFFIAIIVAPPILSMLFPPAFGFTVVGGNVNYEFRSEPIAREFLAINLPDQVPKEAPATVQTA